MYELNKDDYKKIRSYRRFKQEEIALYFFNKFKDDLLDITFSKINRKFRNIPFEKGDLVHLMWKSMKMTLKFYKNEDNFHASLINNCYLTTIREIKKFINNKEMILNTSSSYERYVETSSGFIGKDNITTISRPDKVIVNEIIDIACKYLKRYSQPTIKRVIYFRSMGYSIEEISKKIRKNKWVIRDLLNKIWYIVKNYYF